MTTVAFNNMSHSRTLSFALLAVALFATTADAFVPGTHRTATTTVSSFSRRQHRQGRTMREYATNINGNVERKEEAGSQQSPLAGVPPPPPLSSFDLNDPMAVEAETAAAAAASVTNDPTKEVLLESISRTNPGDVLADAVDETQIAEHVKAIFAEVKDADAKNDNQVGTGVVSLPTATADVNEDVKAVLAFSGEAAAAAEAFIPHEVMEQLERPLAAADAAVAVTNGTMDNGLPVAATPVPVINSSLQKLDAASLLVEQQNHVQQPAQQQQQQNQQPVPETLPASKVVGEAATRKIEAPSVGKILKFAIPAIGVWLCGPLLSLIDTSAVGIFSGTIQQAALNPAVAVTDYAALLIAFMYTGTTNMVAAAQESDRGTTNKPRTAKTMIGAIQLSTYVGAGLGAILFVFARPLLRAIIGNDAISPAVFAAAMKYVRIRALGMPAAAVIGSTQAACLGMQDIRSPLYVLAGAALVNLFGDIFFVGKSNPWIGGAAGAAWATVISQYVAVAFFMRWLTHKPERDAATPPRVLNLSNAILEMTSKKGDDGNNRRQQMQDAVTKLSSPRQRLQERLQAYAEERQEKTIGRAVKKIFGKSKMATLSTTTSNTNAPSGTTNDNFSVRGFLKHRFSPLNMVQFPSKETLAEFKPYFVPVTTTQVGRVSGYVAMSHVVASSLGTVSMAAQQVIVSLFYCLTPVADSLSLTAQSLIPGISEKQASPEKAAALKRTLMGFLKAGAIFGGAMMAAVSAIPLLSGFFTSDPAVIALVNSVVPLLLLFFGIHGFVCGTEGVLLGQKDLGFLGKLYAAFFAAVPYLMLQVKRAALTGSRTVNLTSVWTVFVGYQVVRCGIWLARSFQLQRRSYKAGGLAAALKAKDDEMHLAGLTP